MHDGLLLGKDWLPVKITLSDAQISSTSLSSPIYKKEIWVKQKIDMKMT